jgi:hypothetical protein
VKRRDKYNDALIVRRTGDSKWCKDGFGSIVFYGGYYDASKKVNFRMGDVDSVDYGYESRVHVAHCSHG